MTCPALFGPCGPGTGRGPRDRPLVCVLRECLCCAERGGACLDPAPGGQAGWRPAGRADGGAGVCVGGRGVHRAALLHVAFRLGVCVEWIAGGGTWSRPGPGAGPRGRGTRRSGARCRGLPRRAAAPRVMPGGLAVAGALTRTVCHLGLAPLKADALRAAWHHGRDGGVRASGGPASAQQALLEPAQPGPQGFGDATPGPFLGLEAAQVGQHRPGGQGQGAANGEEAQLRAAPGLLVSEERRPGRWRGGGASAGSRGAVLRGWGGGNEK